MKKTHIIALILITLTLSFIYLNPLGAKADSGFDYSYDSGGWSSYDSDSSWSSHDYSSSSDYGSSQSSSKNYYKDPEDAAMLMIYTLAMILVTVVPCCIFAAFINSGATKPSKFYTFSLDKDRQIPDEKVKEYIQNFDRIPFLKARFEEYKQIQEDWMNFNYDGLKENLTNELYNQYEMQLEALKAKNQINVMQNITYKDSMITGIYKENNKITVEMELIVSQIDCIKQNNIVVRGNPKVTALVHYRLTFVMAERSTKECPNCGAPVNDNATEKCEYCGSVISKTTNKLILSKKECLRQR